MYEKMLNWIGDTIFTIVTAVPALFVDQDSPRFFLIRGMLGLILVVFVVCLMAMRPFRPFLVRCMKMVSNLFTRKA
jgi:hypothetical protein